jgi:hypothetical protein
VLFVVVACDVLITVVAAVSWHTMTA